MAQLIKKINFKNKDFYFMDRIGSSVLVNDNKQSSVLLFDNTLSQVEKIDYDVDVAIHYPLFISFSNESIILYGWDDSILIHINLVSKICKKIPLDQFSKYRFSTLYWWPDPYTIIFYEFSHDTFIMLDINTSKLKEIAHPQIKHMYPMFYNFYVEIKQFISDEMSIERVLPFKQEVLVQDKISHKVIVKSFKDGHEYSCKIPTIKFHDIHYSRPTFSFISEHKIVFKNIDLNEKETIFPTQSSLFYRASFFNPITVAILSGTCNYNNNSTIASTLSLYKIFED